MQGVPEQDPCIVDLSTLLLLHKHLILIRAVVDSSVYVQDLGENIILTKSVVETIAVLASCLG